MYLPRRDMAQDQWEEATTWKGGFEYFLGSSLLGEMIQFDEHFFRNHQLVVGYVKLGHGIKLSLLGEIIHFDDDLLQPGWNRNGRSALVFSVLDHFP